MKLKIYIFIFALLSYSPITRSNECETDGIIKKTSNFLTRLFSKESKVFTNKHTDLYELFKNQQFKNKFLEASKKALKNYSKFDFEIPEIFDHIKNIAPELLNEIGEITKVSKIPPNAKEFLEYKKLIQKILKNGTITYKEYVDLMIYRSLAKSQLLEPANWHFDHFRMLKENYEKAAEAMLKRNIFLAPTYQNFTPKQMNYQLLDDCLIVGMTESKISFDGRANQLPKTFFNHDPGHIHGDIAPFYAALDKGLIDRKEMIGKVLKRIDEIDDKSLNQDLHTIFFAYSHEIGTLNNYDTQIPSKSFKSTTATTVLKKVFSDQGLPYDTNRVKQALDIFDDIWKKSYFD